MSRVQFAVFDHLDKRDGDLVKLYDDRLAFAEAAEACGFAAYYVAEHHSTPLGHAPSPSVFLAALTQRTRIMRIGSMVHVLPTYEPLRLYEEICMLDHLSGGRLEIGVGRGASPFEIGLFGVGSQEARDVFEEALVVLVKGFAGDTLSHRGSFFRYYDVPLTMRPLQRPRPPLWYGALSERNLAFASKHSLNINLNGPPARLRQMAHRYREIWQAEPEGDLGKERPAEPKIGSLYQLLVAETEQEAHVLAESAYAYWYAHMIHLWTVNGASLGNHYPRTTPKPVDKASLSLVIRAMLWIG
jgi:alkanesulfonate monooxygenase SsuD/methylene tetrahydromethanopterin reductase-like flavin-dependent oxidoreductase (luciferase family)